MRPFTILTSSITPIPLKDIDTDLLFPVPYLTNIGSSGFGEHLFERLREKDPQFPLNRPEFSGTQILVTRANFGCGSSREHAVWALLEYGFRAVIAPSFADIFASNSGKNGLLLVRLPERTVETMLRNGKDGGYRLTIDLRKQQVSLPDGTSCDFTIDPFRKECLLNGYDDLTYILAHKHEIERYRSQRDLHKNFSTMVGDTSPSSGQANCKIRS